MKQLLLFLLIGLPLWTTAQSDFRVVSDAGGIQFSAAESDTLEQITDNILEVIENYLPEVADVFKVYDFHFYLHNRSSFQTVDDVIDLAVNSVALETPYYFIIFKEISPTQLIEKVYIKFTLPSDSLPCIDPASFETTFEILAAQHLAEGISISNPSYVLDYLLLNSFRKAISDGFCCSEYINSQNLSHGSGQPRSVSCSAIDQEVVDDLVEFLQSDITYNQGIQVLYTVILWYGTCSSTEWLPLHPEGIVPYCFWFGTMDPNPFPYTSGDLPFTFGCVDGVAIGVRNILAGVLALPELLATVEDAIEAYTIYYVRCSGRNPSDAEMQAAWGELKQINWYNSQFQENFNAIVDFLETGGKEILGGARSLIFGEKSNEAWCAEKEQVRQSIELIANSLTNLDSLESYYYSILEAFSDLWDDVDGLGNEERYYQGCYLMSAAIEMVPISKADLAGDMTSALGKVSDDVNGSQKLGARTKFIKRGSDRLLHKIKESADYKSLDENLQGQFDLDFGGDYTALLKISEGSYVGVWKKWINFPALRTRIDVLEHYFPNRSKIILDVEETFPGCHSIERHGAQLSALDLQLRAKGEHPTLPPSKKSTKFDNEQIHNDAVNAAFDQHKVDIEAHFANGGGYEEWDIDYGSQVGSGYYNSGEYGAGAVLNEVTTTKVKIAFNKDPSNPTGYKMISAYPWYNP